MSKTWKKYSLLDILNQDLKKEDRGWFWLIFIIIFPLYLTYFFSQIPLVFIQIVVLIFSFTKTNLFALILIAIIQFFLYSIVNNSRNLFESKEFINYTKELSSNNIGVEEYNLLSLFNQKQIDFLTIFRTFNDGNTPLGSVFRLIPPKGLEVGQLKGFTLPFVNYFKKANRKTKDEITTKSCLFVRSHPSELTLTEKFLLYHEVGHLSKHAHNIHFLPIYNHASSLILIFIAIFLYEFNSWWQVFLFIPAFLFLFGQPRPDYREDKEEKLCDAFSIELLQRENGINFEKLFRVLRFILPPERLSNIQEYYESNKSETGNTLYDYVESSGKNSFEIFVVILMIFALKDVSLESFIVLYILIGILFILFIRSWKNMKEGAKDLTTALDYLNESNRNKINEYLKQR